MNPPDSQNDLHAEEPFRESCAICGGTLTYLERAAEHTCTVCRRAEQGHVVCAAGHYVCSACHSGSFLDELAERLSQASERSPHRIAEPLLDHPDLPMLGCEHAHIAAGALLTALLNSGTPGVSWTHLEEALVRTRRQAVSAYCGLTGVCGVVPALGAAYSVLLGAQCGRGPETRATMELTARLAAATAEEAHPGCCKAYVRRCLGIASSYLEETLGISLPDPERVTCRHVERHPHGCRGPECEWHPEHGPAEDADAGQAEHTEHGDAGQAEHADTATWFRAADVIASAPAGEDDERDEGG